MALEWIKTEDELAAVAESYNADAGHYFLPDGLIVKWVKESGTAQIVGRWDPALS